jgi:Tol biopolymer transport system component
MTWFDRGGQPAGTLGDPSHFWSLEFSPDRKRVAVSLLGQNQDIWIYDVARSVPRRFTFGPGTKRNPVWSPDGHSIIYTSNAKGQFDLYRKAADLTGNEELLYADAQGKIPTSWSLDGKFLLYQNPQETCGLPLGARSGVVAPLKPFPWFTTPYFGASARFSPDGQWVSYASNESSRRAEIYVAPFPGPSGRRQISNGGGTAPRWRPDGKEIYYRGPNGMLMAAEVSIKGTSLELGAVRSLDVPFTGNPIYGYDVSVDGQRFLVVTPREQKSPASLTLVQNWTGLLKK